MSDKVTEYFNGSFLPSDVWKEKYQLTTIDGEPKEETPEDMHKRMAEHFGRIEESYRSERTSVLKNKPELLSEYGRSRDELYEDKVFELFDEFEYIVPQGSIMSMLGNPYQVGSLSNCIVLPDVVDSYGGIAYTDQQLVQLMKRRCVHEDSFILTEDNGFVRVSDLEEGDRILSKGEGGNEYKRVTDKFIGDNQKDKYQITLQSGTTLNLLEDHQVYLPEQDQYIKAEHLSEGDIAKVSSFDYDLTKFDNNLSDAGWFIGCHIGDGSVDSETRKYQGPRFRIAAQNKNVVDEYGSILNGFVDSERRTSEISKRDDYETDVYKYTQAVKDTETVLNKYLDGQRGSKVTSASVPSYVRENNLYLPFIGGLIDSDGWIKDNGSAIVIRICAKEVIDEVAQVLRSSGFSINVTEKPLRDREDHYIQGKNEIYSLYIRGSSRFWKEIAPFIKHPNKKKMVENANITIHSRKYFITSEWKSKILSRYESLGWGEGNNRLAAVIKILRQEDELADSGLNTLLENEIIDEKELQEIRSHRKIENIKKVDNDDEYYDLTVEENHNFYTGNFGLCLTHNCGVGVDVSRLRPEGAGVRNAARTSTGAVSFMHRFSDTTNEVAQCIEETQEVLTKNGLQKIKNIVMGDEVWTKQGWVSVQNTAESLKGAYRVKTSRGYTIETSKDHVFSVLDDDLIDNKKLDDLKVGDRINLLEGTPSMQQSYIVFSDKWEYEKDSWNNSNQLNEDVNIPEVLNEKFAYVLGVLYGDGHVEKSNNRNAGLSCAFHEDDTKQVKKFLDYFEDTFHHNFKKRDQDNDDACKRFRMYSRKIVSFLNDNGLLKGKAANLSFPEKIKESPVPVQASFVAGYFDADGDAAGSKAGYRFTSIDRNFIENVQKILFSLGITSKIHVEREDNERWSTKYRIAVVGREAQKRFVELIGEESVKTAESGFVAKRDSVLTSYKAETHDISHNKYSYVPDNYHFMSTSCFSRLAEEKDLPKSLIQDEIIDIEHVGRKKMVDLELAQEHLFWCEGFYVHNSGRRGALMLTLDCRHPDMTRFVEEKDDPTAMTGANISAKWTDDFLEAVENNEDYTLRFPVDADPEDADITKEVNARELFKTASENAHIHGGDPGCMYIDRMEDYSTDCGYPDVRVVSTNPCVTGDTLIPTDQGLVEASVLAEKGPQKIITDERIDRSEKYRETTDLGVYKTGVKDVYKVETKEGYALRLTKSHKIKTDDGWVEIQNLQSNDKIHIRKQTGGFGNQGSKEKGRVLGWLVGDGCTSGNTAYLDFYTDEMHLGKSFADDVDQIVRSPNSNREYKANARKVSENQVRIESNRLYDIAEDEKLDQNKLQVPLSVRTGSKNMQKGFLRSLFSADGSVQGSIEKGVSVRLASKSSALLSETQQLLLNFGIYSTIYRERKSAGSKLLPNQKGGYSEYYTEGFHELVISKNDLIRFRDRIGFLLSRKQEELESLLDGYEQGPYSRSFTATVKNIEKDGNEKVYDLTEPETSSFIADGFVVHNCGEVGMFENDSCRLIAMNLMSVVENPFTDDASIDYDLLYKISYEQQRLLDNLVDLEVEAIDKIIEKVKSDPEDAKYKRIEIETWEGLKENGEKYRRTGGGFTALGDMLAALGIEYGSEECDEVLHEVMSTKLEGEWDASTDLAIERGTFPEWDSQYDDTEFFDMLEEEFPEIYERNMEHGRRNISLSTVAPTGSVSLMSKIEEDFGTTSGIEPLFSTEKNKAWHIRNKRADGSEDYDYVDEEGNKWKQYPVFHNGFRIWMEENGYENPTEKPEEELKEIFKESPYVTSAGLHWKDRLRTQGIVQQYVSHSISSTLNLPEDADAEETYKIYKNGRKYGLKGATIFRNGSKRGVLEGEDGGSSDESEITYHDAPERPEVLEADIHQVRYNGEPWKILVGRLEGKPYEVFAIKTGEDTGIRVRFTDSDDNKIEEGLIRKTDSGVYNFEAKDGKVVIEDIAEYAPDDNVRVDTRLLSLNLRHGVKPEYLVSQLEKADGSVVSFGRAILKALRSYLDVDPDDKCPECGEESLAFVESCLKCRTCGWSRC